MLRRNLLVTRKKCLHCFQDRRTRKLRVVLKNEEPREINIGFLAKMPHWQHLSRISRFFGQGLRMTIAGRSWCSRLGKQTVCPVRPRFSVPDFRPQLAQLCESRYV